MQKINNHSYLKQFHSLTMKLFVIFLMAIIFQTIAIDTDEEKDTIAYTDMNSDTIQHMRRLVRKPTNSVTIRQVNVANICQNRTAEDLVKNDKDCSKFFVCINNETIVEGNCPNNMYYNDKIKLCDIASNVICENNPSDDINMDINMEIANATAYCATKSQIPNQIVFVGSAKNCHQYYICYHDRALLQECSENLHWNSFIGKCDKPDNAGCTLDNSNNNNIDLPAPISTSSTTVMAMAGNRPSPMANLNCPPDGEHIFPSTYACGFFIYCVRGVAILQQCPFYHYFDLLTKSCQWRTKALCVRDLALNLHS